MTVSPRPPTSTYPTTRPRTWSGPSPGSLQSTASTPRCCEGQEEVIRISGERGIDRPRIERAVREILLAIGEDPVREGLIETPDRVAEAYAHLFSGLFEDPASYLESGFIEGARDLVLVRDLPMAS